MSLAGMVTTLEFNLHSRPLTEADGERNVGRFSMACMFAKMVIDLFLCGVFTMQLARYIRYHSGDARWVKFIVAASSFMTYLISAYICWCVAYLFVNNFGTYAPFLSTKYIAWFPVLNAVTSSIVQGFFTHRCWRLCNRNWYLMGLLIFLIAGYSAWACSVTRKLWEMDSFLDVAHARLQVVFWLCSIMLVDIVITLAIIYGLLRNRTGWAPNDRMILRLVRMNLEAQTPPTILAVVFLIVFLINPTSLLNLLWQGIQSKFYLIGLLYSLNARVRFRMAPDGLASVAKRRGTLGERITVQVETETFEMRVENEFGKPTLNRPNLERLDEVETTPDPKSRSVKSGHSTEATEVGERVEERGDEAVLGVKGSKSTLASRKHPC